MDKNMENEMETCVILGYMRLYRGYMGSMMGSIRFYWGLYGDYYMAILGLLLKATLLEQSMCSHVMSLHVAVLSYRHM